MREWKEKKFAVGVGVFLVLLGTSFLYFGTGHIAEFVENQVYAFQLKRSYLPVSKDIPIAIIDIDDRSLNVEGRWPWPRDKIARLVDQLFSQGVSVAAFDIVFLEPEKNQIQEIISVLQEEKQKIPSGLKQLEPFFAFDEQLAKSIAKGTCVLGYFLTNTENSRGTLPSALLVLNKELAEELFIPNMKNYLANIEILQKASPNGGFINAAPDIDGISRFAPLLLRKEENVFPCLSLDAVRLFLQTEEVKLLTETYGSQTVLKGISLGNREINTDPWGRILIPFRGPPRSLPYFSATDVLTGVIPKEALEKKLVFIGSSAVALGDILATPISPTFSGVEVHADIASGILDHYLPYKPTWGKGVSVGLLLTLGLLCAFYFPFLGPFGSTGAILGLLFFLSSLNWWLWVKLHLVLSFLFPISILIILYFVNLIYGYLLEKTRREKNLHIFGQYIPPERIEAALKQEGAFNLEGEEKELTVLFADIRGFTSIAETMSAEQVKKMLNLYLTPITQIIFDHKGTIDKYVGDAVMAFWGAPLEDPQSALHAIDSGLEMQKKLAELNGQFQQMAFPQIQIGVGINTGLMNVGDMGSKFRLAYTVIGDAVNLASRLETICRFYDVAIIVGEKTYTQAKEHFGFRKLDRVQIRGKKICTEIYQPLCKIDQCSKEVVSLMQLHAESMEAYFKQDWKKAQEGFRALLTQDPLSGRLYQLYLDRVEKFSLTSPGAEWNGAYILDMK